MTRGEVVFRAQGAGKRYAAAIGRARETVPEALRRLLAGASSRREFWALRNVDFEVRRGEAVAVIGPNGAGKSTLLLLLARIVDPSAGVVEVKGSTSLLFQVASGLQPRLSVLDNFWVCSALLGFPREEFRRRLPEIAAYAGLSDRLHVRYGELSSGMAARLPFSVAVHGELDVVLSDEMIAVGDQAFRRRCVDTFQRLRGEGKTIVVATHDLDLARSLCSRAIYLDAGRVVFDGPVADAVAAYEKAGA